MSNETYIAFYLKSSSIYIYSKAIQDIGRPKYIRFLIREDGRSLIVEAYHKQDLYSFRLRKLPGHTGWGFELINATLCRLLMNMLNWEKGESYRIPGKTYPKQKIVVFDLTAYEKIEGRKTFTIQKVPIAGGDLIK